jgi:type IV secretion system protein VirB2
MISKLLKNPAAVMLLALVTVFALSLFDPAYAAGGGLDKVNEGLENIRTGLLVISAVVITLAIMWAGYKLLVAHAQVMDIARIFCGAMLIGGASGIAGWFL